MVFIAELYCTTQYVKIFNTDSQKFILHVFPFQSNSRYNRNLYDICDGWERKRSKCFTYIVYTSLLSLSLLDVVCIAELYLLYVLCFQVLDIIAFICASIHIGWGPYGGGWVQFVTMSAFITTLLLFGFHLFRIIYKLPGPWGLIVSNCKFLCCFYLICVPEQKIKDFNQSQKNCPIINFGACQLYRTWSKIGSNPQSLEPDTLTTGPQLSQDCYNLNCNQYLYSRYWKFGQKEYK